MKRTLVGVTTAVAALAVGVALSAGGTSAAKITVSLKEFKIVGAPLTVKAGTVTFRAKNIGKVVHELLVVKSTAAPGKLPVKAGKAVVVKPLVKLLNVAPGKTSAAVTVKLTPGKYILLCNIPGHYLAGQYAALVVK